MDRPASDAPLIETHSLTRHYRVGPATVRALDGVDLQIGRGELLAVLGVSGSGKSTLLHLLGGLDTPTSGSVTVEGRDLGRLSGKQRAVYRRSSVGFVFQSFYLVPGLSAQQNVAVALTFQGVFGRRRRELARQAICRVGLEQRAHHRPNQLSGGEQQRVALARAIVHRPPLLLADEPTGNLDRANADNVMALIREIHEETGTTVVIVTHNEDMARQATDRIVRLTDGRVTADEGTQP
ncbi:MAG: ABC transporter ATP-binding protein [Planctomycetaceae bacterium]|nr:ABC transporter ATP-binding protein [Planctomycetaceae bacterium]